MNLKLSIIVPIYNVESYLKKCLDSIIMQTFSNFELILINDGSTDQSGEICDEYEKRDSRIKVIHQENGGVSSARNSGLDIAIGKYIGFIDPDDTLERDMFEQLIQASLDHHADIVVCSYRTINLITSTEKTSPIWKQTDFPIDKASIAAEIIPSVLDTKYLSLLPCWNKLYKRSLFDGQQNRFDESRKHGEDARLNLILLTQINTLVFIKPPLYHYYIHPRQSLTQKFYADLFDYLLDNKRFGTSLCNQYNSTKAIKRITNDFIIGSLTHMQDVANSHLSKQEKYKILHRIMNHPEFIEQIEKGRCPSKYYKLLKRISILRKVSLFVKAVKVKNGLQKTIHVLMGKRANNILKRAG